MADVIATERIYEDLPIARSDRRRRVLRYGIGAVVPEADQKRLGVTSKGTQSKVPEAEIDASGGVVPLPSAAAPITTSPQGDPATAGSVKAEAPATKSAAKKAPAKKATAAKKAAAKRS